MKQFLLVISLLLQASFILAQTNNQVVDQKSVPAPNTYAVVVGISKYENKGIEQLEYADRDAGVFATYLRSKAGGKVPEDHIRLLLNDDATYAAVYNALNWLLETCGKDDIVYFYFSGHGDMENSTIYKLGFLLTYNTPRTNYINNSLRIEDLNNIANTLSVKAKAKVILITDACHSGKLAGNDYHGTYLVGEQLRTVKNNEIRITSCATDQLSAEDGGWGGGRGVFSYYLVNGLKGLADKQHDGIVTLKEISNYLDSSMASDVLLIQKNHRQTPVIKGNDDFKMATVDKDALNAMIMKSPAPVIVGSTLQPLAKQPQAYFFDVMVKINPEEVFDFNRIDQLPAAEIPNAFIKGLPDNLLTTEIKEKLTQLQLTIAANKDALNRFNSKLVTILSDRGQQLVNQYLDADSADLDSRSYYNVNSSPFDKYPKMFSIAMKLTEPSNYLYHILEIKLHYFSGLALRLKTVTVKDPKPLLQQALQEQLKALSLEENAAYIQNELGVLYKTQGLYDKAEKYFLRATEIAPAWAIPWSNLVGLYVSLNKLEKAQEASAKAIALEPALQWNYVNTGVLNEKKGNLLVAEELFQRAIAMNSNHFLPFERLGYVYMRTTQYAAADTFLYKSEERAATYNLQPIGIGESTITGSEWHHSPDCILDTLSMKKNDVIGHFVWAFQYYDNEKFDDAERIFKKLIVIERSNPLAFHYLGIIFYKESRLQEAEIMFKLAKQNYVDSIKLSRYCDSKRIFISNKNYCLVDVVRESHYDQKDDFYYLAYVYEGWNHFQEAEKVYRSIIQMDPGSMQAYIKLYKLFENTGRYTEAEDLLNEFSVYYHDDAIGYLEGFYINVTRLFPGDLYWQYKYGLFLYKLGNKNYDGISYLQQADSLLQDNDAMRADIYDKIGDMYVRMRMNEKASVYYKRAVDIKHDAGDSRDKMIDASLITWHLTDALEQLDSLYSRKEISYSQQLILAKFYIHSGRFEEAESVLRKAKDVYPYEQPEVDDLFGRLYLLSGNPQKALTYYRQYLAADTANSSTMYTIAILYKQTGNEEMARKYLQRSISAGFNYYGVLKSDPNWEGVRNKPGWSHFFQKH